MPIKNQIEIIASRFLSRTDYTPWLCILIYAANSRLKLLTQTHDLNSLDAPLLDSAGIFLSENFLAYQKIIFSTKKTTVTTAAQNSGF
jgi:hypothetical protein